ncbi:MAG: NAD(P)-binding domain-containing protein [Bacteroidetes bacterium]|nr:NAD(P)-binding domain-containing protein [Bacteroidota bacterium]
MKIVLIGSGNIATFFGKKFQTAGFEIVQVISYHLSHAEQLANQLACSFSDNMLDVNRDADVYLFAVKDDVLLEMAKRIFLPDKLVIHTAGSIHLHELAMMSNQLACLWCVYSISKKELPDKKIFPLW